MWKPRLSATPRLRLFCFHHAGGSASGYRPWFDWVPGDVDLCPIQLPGREGRFTESPVDDPEVLLDRLHEALAPWLDRPFVLAGYSMGALLAHRLACRLRPHERAGLQRLMLGVCSSPDHALRVALDRLDRQGLIDYLHELGGTPPEVFEHQELMDLMLPMLSADFRLVARLRAMDQGGAAHLLDCPITVLGALSDAHARPEQIAGWAAYTRGGCRQILVPGGHFSPWQQPGLLVDAALGRDTVAPRASMPAE